jgi:protocatechuate 3,4-dioxygenase beta subunit
VDGAPERQLGASIADADDGEPLVVQGTVTAIDGRPVAGADIDVWQTNSNGFYDVQDPTQPAMNLRGRFRADAEGRYWFRTVRPVAYSIPDDGPVGRMLAATGRHSMRPAHIHLIVSAPGYRPITTHLFDAGSEHLDGDAVFGVRPSLIVAPTTGDDGVLHARFDVVLDVV